MRNTTSRVLLATYDVDLAKYEGGDRLFVLKAEYHNTLASRTHWSEEHTLPSSNFHVIGAGTGGLCLTRGLKQADISVAVYGRDRTRADGLFGYRVGISPDGNTARRDRLPPELFETYIATTAKTQFWSVMLTEQLAEMFFQSLDDFMDMTTNWHPNTRKLFGLADSGAIFTIIIRSLNVEHVKGADEWTWG